MQTQRDHVHAHQFMVGRLSSALVAGDPTGADVPARRANTGLLTGILLAVLVAAGFGVYGWIVPGGSKAFRQAGAILVEKETGIRYVYLDGVLHPTPDLTSAMLIQGAGAHVKMISRASLKGVPRGAAVGIPGAPHLVPAAADMVAGPWLTCLPGSVVDRPGARFGVNLDPRAAADPLPDDAFALVSGPDGTRWLLTPYARHRVGDDAVLVALGAAGARTVRAPSAWIGWLPEGPALEPARIPEAGTDGPVVAGRPRPVGTLFRQRPAAGAEQHFVLRADGLAPLSRTEFVLLEASTGRAVVDLGSAAVAQAQRSADRTLTRRLPDLAGARWHDHGDRVLCLQQRPVTADSYAGRVVFAARADAGVDPDGRSSVVTRPASGMLAVPVPAPRTGPGVPLWLVGDDGTAYRIADATALDALRLRTVPLVPVPAKLLAELPQGPVLSRAAATQIHGR